MISISIAGALRSPVAPLTSRALATYNLSPNPLYFGYEFFIDSERFSKGAGLFEFLNFELILKSKGKFGTERISPFF